MTKLKIKVTKDILERSKYCGFQDGLTVSENCAVALAVRDIWPNAAVDGDNIWPNAAVNDGIMPLPTEVSVYIIEFDNTYPADRAKLPEIEFEIEIPDKVLESINIEELKPLLENHPTLQLIEN